MRAPARAHAHTRTHTHTSTQTRTIAYTNNPNLAQIETQQTNALSITGKHQKPNSAQEGFRFQKLSCLGAIPAEEGAKTDTLAQWYRVSNSTPAASQKAPFSNGNKQTDADIHNFRRYFGYLSGEK